MVVEQAGRAHLSLIAAIAPNGRLYLAGQDSPFTGEDMVWFINKLCGRYRKRNLLLIWQGRLCGWSRYSSESSCQRFTESQARSDPSGTLACLQSRTQPCRATMESTKTEFSQSGLHQFRATSGRCSRAGSQIASRQKNNHCLLPQKGSSLLYKLTHGSIIN